MPDEAQLPEKQDEASTRSVTPAERAEAQFKTIMRFVYVYATRNGVFDWEDVAQESCKEWFEFCMRGSPARSDVAMALTIATRRCFDAMQQRTRDRRFAQQLSGDGDAHAVEARCSDLDNDDAKTILNNIRMLRRDIDDYFRDSKDNSATDGGDEWCYYIAWIKHCGREGLSVRAIEASEDAELKRIFQDAGLSVLKKSAICSRLASLDRQIWCMMPHGLRSKLSPHQSDILLSSFASVYTASQTIAGAYS